MLDELKVSKLLAGRERRMAAVGRYPAAMTLPQVAPQTTAVLLQVGAQLQRDAAAGWRLVTNIMTQTTYQVTAPATLSSAGDVGGPASDVLKKMMQKREQELQ